MQNKKFLKLFLQLYSHQRVQNTILHRLRLRKSTRKAIDHNIFAWVLVEKIKVIKSDVIVVELIVCERSIKMDDMYQLQNLYTNERIFVPGKREKNLCWNSIPAYVQFYILAQ